MKWHLYHKDVTRSTNLDARGGKPGDVFTADAQLAGRGRLDHPWHSGEGENLALSAVLDVANCEPEVVATIPLVVGLAVARAMEVLLHLSRVGIKWPNDILVNGHKIAGILCERHGDRVIAGVGVNVKAKSFPKEFAARATSLVQEGAKGVSVWAVRDEILTRLGRLYALWREKGFAAIYPEIAARDILKGRFVEVAQGDNDTQTVHGLCGGIASNGSLNVAGEEIYAGEAHILTVANEIV